MTSLDVKAEWEAVHSRQHWGHYPETDFLLAISHVAVPAPLSAVRVLDAGCGNGAVMAWVLREGAQAYGIDISETAIQRTREFLEGQGVVNPNLVVGTLTDLPYEDGFFAMVIDVCSIQHNPPASQERILTEVTRVLRPGGLFVSVFMGAESTVRIETPYTHPLLGKEVFDLVSAHLTVKSMEHSTRTHGNGATTLVRHIVIAQKERA